MRACFLAFSESKIIKDMGSSGESIIFGLSVRANSRIGAFGERKKVKNMGSLGESMVFGSH